MKREDIERLRQAVSCGAVLETAGFAIDLKESTRRAVKYRRAGEIVIVTHEGRGWFDPLGDDKGDVFSLVVYLDHVAFPEGIERVAALVGFQPSEPAWSKPISRRPEASLAERWQRRSQPWPGSASWKYLCGERYLPATVLRVAISQDSLREGPRGSMWAAHMDFSGHIQGWEARGPEWRGFATGGTKTLFRLGPPNAQRMCVTEAAIDAMSLAAIEGMREDTLYLSTGGGWSPATEVALGALSRRAGAMLIAATDANSQGDAFAHRLCALAEHSGCGWQRLRPPTEDWNEALKQRGEERRDRSKRRAGVPHSHRPRQGRLRPAEPALDPVEPISPASNGCAQRMKTTVCRSPADPRCRA
jgi:hypothetical protein